MENKMDNEFQRLPDASGTRPTYWLTRFLILRLLGMIYAVAFLAAINQILPLIGANGLLPVGIYLHRISDALGSPGAGFA
ncbi:MAG TPA: lipase maturation factor family protein, partial [Puia sp.]|nr:lipase maturation factor family protein [Puia sp.]